MMMRSINPEASMQTIERDTVSVGDRAIYHDWWHHTDHPGKITEINPHSPSTGCSILFDSPHPEYGDSLWLMQCIAFGGPSLKRE